MANTTLRIGRRQYHLDAESGVFLVPLAELDDLRLADLPPHSTTEVIGLPESQVGYRFSIRATNGGDEHDDKYFTIACHVSFTVAADVDAKINRIRRTFLPLVESGILPDPLTMRLPSFPTEAGASYIPDYAGRGNTIIRDALAPVLAAMKRLTVPEARIFICHASEDTAFAHSLANYLTVQGADVLFDQWEIKVGDSIVEKINEGLGEASHLAILLSTSSVAKPWVRKELSAALMRHLKDKSVGIVPLLIDDCPIPPILADIRYADCRHKQEEGFKSVVAAVLGSR